MNSAEIRKSFVDFFVERDHRAVASAPLVPHGDATLLFTNAGMVQFKDQFTGAATPASARAVSVQKCLRVSGKHNDLENVGPSPRHHTFFEMLGNFSFGDYFKAEAIEWGWKLVTEVWGLPPERLFATIFTEDDEAAALWAKISGLPTDRILRCGEKDNFWAMGETGPCGPCSEIFVDLAPAEPQVGWEAGNDSGRYVEIWNLVFMQFERDGKGNRKLLPSPSIDTGAGLERVAAVLAGVRSNYDTDLFRPILDGAAVLAATEYGREADADVSLRVVADHLRAIAFLLADGVVPANDGRGYVLRRLLRRAVRHGLRIGLEDPFLHRLLPLVDEAMAGHYPELAATRVASEATVKAEEERFLSTLAAGSREEQRLIEELRAKGGSRLEGRAVFLLKDTLGMPIEVIREIAEEERFTIDETGFEQELEAQRERSRAAGAELRAWQLDLKASLAKELEGQAETEFVGHIQGSRSIREELSVEGARVLAVRSLERDESESDAELEAAVMTAEIGAGGQGVVVVDRTPFYAESGGQVGDVGEMTWDGGRAKVVGTRSDNAGHVLHFVEVEEGGLVKPFPSMNLLVSPGHRLPTQRNHTATHLLHAALREALGEGVRQAGSLVHPDYLRFDFTFGHPLTEKERQAITARVNEWILAAIPLEIVADRPIDEAKAAGAMALFGEKYGGTVRTVAVPGVSLELCGGCHVRNTGEIGPFVLRSERGVASGVRRIEALTGEKALAYLGTRDAELATVESALGVEPGHASDGVIALRRQLKDRDAELSTIRLKMASGANAEGQDYEVDGIKIRVREVLPAPPAELRQIVDRLRDQLGSGAVVVAARTERKVTLLVASSEDVKKRIPAGRLVREIAALVGGSGGGRDDFAQAGGKWPERLPEALEQVPALVEEIAGDG